MFEQVTGVEGRFVGACRGGGRERNISKRRDRLGFGVGIVVDVGGGDRVVLRLFHFENERFRWWGIACGGILDLCGRWV
jgi:hypothetical protein